jgi:sugar/nucleoside kinase (ribokinase family)
LKKVVVIGDVIEDIIVISEGERRANTDNPSSIQSTPGGSGANFAVWLASLSVETELIARVSNKDKERLESYFKSVHVKPNLQTDQELETGKIVVLVEGNQRTFFTDRAANKNLEKPELPKSDLLYVSGYSVLSLGKEQTQALMKTAKAAGCLVAVDPGSTSFIEGFGVGKFLEAIRGADIIFPNKEEYELLSKDHKLTEVFPEILVTKGEQGAELVGIASVEAKIVEAIDPTGAGDAFAAKYIAERLSGSSPIEALEYANDFAALAVTRPGGQPS